MSDRLRSYRIKYDLHCKLQNFFGKEIVVKNCYSEVHAKYKLGAYCEKKCGADFDFITFKSVTEEGFEGLFNDIFGNPDTFNCGSKTEDLYTNLLKNLKNKKK
jgi:hypothetical protein